MNIKAFFVDALTAALDQNLGTPDDVLRHVTPEILSIYLPRPLWARLLTACLGAPRVSATLVVETIGIANLCEHIPAQIIWGFIADIAQRSLGIGATAPGVAMARSGIIAPPPDVSANAPTTPTTPVAVSQNNPGQGPLQDVISELESEEPRQLRVPPARSPTAQRFRQSGTGVGRSAIGSNVVRRPQAPAPPTTLPRPSASVSIPTRRAATETSEPDPATSVETSDWGNRELVVDDSQLVDWQTDIGTGNAITGDDDFSDLGNRKR